MSVPNALALAQQHLLASRLLEAEEICQKVLQRSPKHHEAHRLLGIIAFELGNRAAAAEFFQHAVANNPNAQGFLTLASVLISLGQFEEAEIAARNALAIEPKNAQAEFELGRALQFRDRREEATEAYRRALVIQPNYAEAQNNLANVLKDSGRMEESLEAYHRALAIRPDYAEALSNLGNALFSMRRYEEALEPLQQALTLRPNLAEAECGRANVLYVLGRIDEAEQAYRRASEIRPNLVDAQNNLGNVFRLQGKLEEAEAAYRQALVIQPSYPDAENNLGGALKDQGRLNEAVLAYQRALAIQPNFPVAHSNLLYIQLFLPETTLASLTQAHAEWDQRYAVPLRSTWQAFSNHPDPDRKLRLGFVSSNFGRHPCGYFLIRGLKALDVENFETVLYSDRVTKDDLTDRIVTAAGTWREVWNLSDQELADRIREDRIDVLIGMAGHTRGNRLLMLARKPAPILVTWTGYAGSTGLSAIDYLLVDRFHIPEELQGQYIEKIIRLPDGYVCYDPPGYAPPVGPLPCETNGYITLGSFNQAAKYNSEVVAVWSEILGRLPDSRLVLKFKGLVDPSTCRRFQDQFTAAGLDGSRLELLGGSPHAELLAMYGRIDITLDPFPFSGGLTTCESLWMGVPVITCPGETFASRHSLSHLSNIGSTETIAKDLAEYVEIAVGLGQNIPHLAELRAGLRQRMAQSPLCDGKRFAENMQQALRTVWRDWCVNSK